MIHKGFHTGKGVKTMTGEVRTDETLMEDPEYSDSFEENEEFYQEEMLDEDDKVFLDPVSAMLRDFGRNPVMSVEEFNETFHKYQETGDHFYRNKIVEGNVLLVVSVAKKFKRQLTPFNDLVQEGMFGLMTAVDKFNPEKDCKFSTYATWWIRQAIIRYIENNESMIRIPVHSAEKLNRIRRTNDKLTFENGFVPTIEETLKAAGISEEEYQLLLELPVCDLSLDQEINPDDGDGDATLLNFYVKQDDVTSEDECVIQERNELLMECIRSLSHSNQEVIDRRFGLTTGIRESLAMIANDMGISRERIRQKEKESLRKLRKKQKLKQYVLGEF